MPSVSNFMSEANKVESRDARLVRPWFKIATHQRRTDEYEVRIISDFVSALHSKPTLFAAFLLFLAKNAMSASLLNAFS